MRKIILLIIVGVTIIALSGAFFVARSVLALASRTVASPASPIIQTTPATPIQPTPFANGNTNRWPNAQSQQWGSGGQGMYEGPWNRSGGMMGRSMMGMSNCDQMPGNWHNTSYGLAPDNNTVVSPEDVSFSADIQPTFNARCISCHGGTNGLYLTSYEDLMQGSVNGPVIMPGDPNSSRLIRYVSNGYMPLGGPPLSTGQIQTLSNWVAAGAPNN